jgi:predicted LPLAT superfamily acyltransferase
VSSRLLERLELDEATRRRLDRRHYLSLGIARTDEVIALADRLRVHLVVYDSLPAATEAALCHLMEAAHLSSLELRDVVALERSLGPRAIVVAYARPARPRIRA